MVLASLPAAALAWPVDGHLEVEPGKDRLVKFAALEWAQVDDPLVAEVEVMPESGELLVTGKKAGRALVQLWAQGRSAVWRLRVGTPLLDEPQVWAAAAKACKGVDPKARELLVNVESEQCRAALLKVLEQDRLLPRDISLNYEVKVLQGQLIAMQAALDAQKLPVRARYEGAGLILEGTVDDAARRRTYFELFKKSAGRLAVTDRLEAPAPAAAQQEKGR